MALEADSGSRKHLLSNNILQCPLAEVQAHAGLIAAMLWAASGELSRASLNGVLWTRRQDLLALTPELPF